MSGKKYLVYYTTEEAYENNIDDTYCVAFDTIVGVSFAIERIFRKGLRFIKVEEITFTEIITHPEKHKEGEGV